MAYKIGQVVLSNPTDCYQVQNGNYSINGTPTNASAEIYNQYGIYNLSHFGIQSRPGAVFAIDDEVIIIGRSGSYELSNNLVAVNNLQLLSADTFIIDFKY